MPRAIAASLFLSAALSASANAQLISSWNTPPVDDGAQPNSAAAWHTNVATGEIIELPALGSPKALAADNTLGLLYSCTGSSLTTSVADGTGNFVPVASLQIRDANGVAALSYQVESIGFANGVIYASVGRNSSDDRRNRGIKKGLYAINPTTAVATLIPAASNLPLLRGLDFNQQDGRLYAVVGGNRAQSIVSIDTTTFAMTTIAAVPTSAYGSDSFSFDGVAAGEGKVYLTNGVWYTNIPIVVFNLASRTFEHSLPTAPRSAENRFYPSGATYFAPDVIGERWADMTQTPSL